MSRNGILNIKTKDLNNKIINIIFFLSLNNNLSFNLRLIIFKSLKYIFINIIIRLIFNIFILITITKSIF